MCIDVPFVYSESTFKNFPLEFGPYAEYWFQPFPFRFFLK